MATYAEMERMSGPDALMLHMERPTVPMHTLKVVVLEPGAGGPLSLADLRTAVAPYLGLVRRSTQKVYAAPGVGGRPFWAPDPHFELDDHLDEHHAADGRARRARRDLRAAWPSDTSTAPARCGR